MKIVIGTKNQAKIEAVIETLTNYELLKNALIMAKEVASGVSEQPKSLEETIQGAMNRAKNAFEKVDECAYGFGLESGIFPVPNTKTGWMDTTVCAIYDSHNFHLGLSSCFEYPRELTRLVNEQGITVSQAANEAGISDKLDLGAQEGMIGILTRNRLTRKGYTKQAIITALIHLENPALY